MSDYDDAEMTVPVSPCADEDDDFYATDWALAALLRCEYPEETA